MIDISRVQSHTRTTVRVDLTGAPVQKADFLDRNFLPDHIRIDYDYSPTVDERGWTHHTWLCRNVVTDGLRILKSGPNGEQRVGKDRHRAEWWSWSGVELLAMRQTYRSAVPEWIVKLVEEMRPSGDVTVAGE